MTQLDFQTILPLTLLTVWACVLLLLDLYIPKDRKGLTALLSALGLAVTLGFTLSQIGVERTGFFGMVVLEAGAPPWSRRMAARPPEVNLRRAGARRTLGGYSPGIG